MRPQAPPELSPRPPASARVATSWTRPLQFAIAVWYSLGALFTLAVALWKPTWLPVIYSGAFEAGSVIGVVSCVVAVIGAVKRWTWLYKVLFALFGLGTLVLPLNLIRMVTGGAAASIYAEAVAFEIPGAVLFAWMVLVSRRGLGPWAMAKPRR